MWPNPTLCLCPPQHLATRAEVVCSLPSMVARHAACARWRALHDQGRALQRALTAAAQNRGLA